ncbi:MAG: DUF3048 domain-containing protein [Ruminococcaceae bacterium]|nr:DUF3048 domain-containing protein [Oscillospiraceae bacterium]
METEMNHFKKTAAFLLSALICASAAGCSFKVIEPETEKETTAPETEYIAETETETEVETEAETELETASLLPHEAELVENPVTGSAHTDDSSDETGETRIYNYLNGAAATAEEQARRPVAIMMNNIKNCLPQNGLTSGDIFYECAAEGGITRIMMLVSDYEKLSEVGSIRSSRDYFIDFIENHNAIYIHAGGSEMAYDKIDWRGTDNLDGVNMYVPDMFYRDNDRLYSMGLEHSLMTTGEKIAEGIAFKNYATEHDDSFAPAFKFYDETVDHQPEGSIATHVHMESTSIQTVDFVYNEETGEYLRYQYNGMPQVDGLTDEQLSVKNVLILFTDISLIPGDAAGRLSVKTEGSGQGYYITNGRRKVITWSRAGKTDPVKLRYKDGEELLLNCGKTFVCVVDTSVADTLVFDYSWN